MAKGTDDTVDGGTDGATARRRREAPAGEALEAMVSGRAPARSFPPIEGEVAHTLVLGTMPGTASLGADEYYAHPMNAFWPIALSIVSGAPPERRAWCAMSHAARAARFADAGFALWDVLAECRRPGSLDGAIVRASEVANDVAGLVARHPELRRVAFNGRAAETLFARHVDLPGPEAGGPERVALPSTSPAMAALSFEAKHEAWARALDPATLPRGPRRGGRRRAAPSGAPRPRR